VVAGPNFPAHIVVVLAARQPERDTSLFCGVAAQDMLSTTQTPVYLTEASGAAKWSPLRFSY
jgi:hypothetical protein